VSDIQEPSNWFNKALRLLKPSRTIPITPWRADSTWGLIAAPYAMQRMLVLIFGLMIFGIGEAFLVVTSLGNSPWVVLSEGISLNSSLNIGESTFVVSVVVLLLWIIE
jgi:hypothetical protein